MDKYRNRFILRKKNTTKYTYLLTVPKAHSAGAEQ